MYGLLLALASAVLFGAATPATKALVGTVPALQLAGLLYLGAALGIAPLVVARGSARRSPSGTNRRRLAGAVVFGGIVAPVLLLLGLRRASSGSVALMLNLEVAATAVLGVLVFQESLGRRGWLGVGLVLAGGVLLAVGAGWPGVAAAALVGAACTCWALDNNLTALIDGLTPAETTVSKAAVAGTTNLVLGLALQPARAPIGAVAAALAIGALSYGVSMALYVTAAQQVGAVRSQSVFAVAPFVGAALSWLCLQEPVRAEQLAAGALFVAAVVLLARDRHAHPHVHEALAHVHPHRHDDGHHDHEHPGLARDTRHTHWHEHARAEHTHAHVADLHHRHGRYD